ncbi:cytochrome c1 [Parvularcula marina]|uniref:cytochrome c1 n=1 Tax=Parvularcula marina TaxID=2292771 RepID=UPI00351891CE
MRKVLIQLSAALAVLGGATAVAAEGETKPLLHHHWHSDGLFGEYDKAQLQRGYQVYREVCAACHSMELVAFRHLGDKGGPYYLAKCPEGLGLPESTDCSNPVQNPIIKSLAASFQVTDGPDDAGDMFQRPGLPADYFPSPYENKNQAKAANGGAYPPDMSLLAKARHHGPSYIYSLMLGYEEPPATIEVPASQYYNVFYPGDTSSLVKEEYLDDHGHILEDHELPPGGVFKMAPPLSEGVITYEDGSPETVEQYAADVAAFLTWAAEPKMDQRKAQGRFVLLFLIIFAGIVYASYRQIWRDVH